MVAAVLFGIVAMADVSTAAERRGEVLIYYANETAPVGREAANYETIIGWLRSSENPKHTRIARQLEVDRKLFSAARDVELGVIIDQIPDLRDGPQGVVFTNRLARKNKCLVWRRGWEEFREVEFSVSDHPNYILAANPLSRPDVMRQALAFVADQFSPTGHEFLLVTCSHGSKAKAITPRLIVRAEETNREELLAVAAGDVEGDDLPQWAGEYGIAKDEYFSIIGQAGERHDMRFPLVYWEACNAWSDDLERRLPPNVERMLLTRDDTFYINFLYGDLLSGLDDGERLCDAMTRNLPPKFVLLGEGQPASSPSVSAQSWIYFIPMGLFIIWVAWRWGPWERKPVA